VSFLDPSTPPDNHSAKSPTNENKARNSNQEQLVAILFEPGSFQKEEANLLIKSLSFF